MALFVVSLTILYLNPEPGVANQAIFLALAIFFAYLSYRGFVLCRFLGHSLVVQETSLIVDDGDGEEYLARNDVEFRVENRIEVLSIYRRDGSLAYTVDYFAPNARSFALEIFERKNTDE